MGLESGMRIGKYELGMKLGEGGFGVVFRGRDTDLDRDVALKFMHAEHTANKDILQRFLQEARSAARISHNGIVTVYECGQVTGTGTDVDGMAFIAMELLDGEALSDRLRRNRRLSPQAAMDITRQVAIALEAAHRAGIIHRDLKPDNIFLVPDPMLPNGIRVKVLDFGIAKLAQQQSSVATQSQMVFGTPRYMSPEQCRSAAKIDHRSDIYTLGCILFELVTGDPPFDGEVGELIAKHQMVAPRSSRTLNPDLPLHLDVLIAKTLAKAPGERPQTMAELARSLETGGAIGSAGIAPTLLPDAAESLQQFTPLPGSIPPPNSEQLAAARGAAQTTLGEASVSRQVSPKPSSKRFLAITAIAVVALAGGGIYLATRGDSKETATGSAPQPQPPPPPPAAPKDVEVEIAANPKAEVYLVADGRYLGDTPFTSRRAPADGSMVYVLKAEGFKDQRVIVPANKDFKQTFELVALKPAAGSGSGSSVAVTKPPKQPPKPPKQPPDGPKQPPKPGSGSSTHIDVYPD